MKKKLNRNTEDKLIAGVMSGLADYFGQDIVLIRLLGAAAFIFSGFLPFGLLYAFAWVIIPERRSDEPEYTVVK